MQANIILYKLKVLKKSVNIVKLTNDLILLRIPDFYYLI